VLGQLTVSLPVHPAYLDEQAEAKKKATAKRKRESEAEELDKLKTKKARLEQDVKTLEKSADKLAEKAETTQPQTDNGVERYPQNTEEEKGGSCEVDH